MALGAVTRSDLADPAPYTKTFFDLQLRFAHTVSALSGLPLARAILEYTNFYIRFGLGREFNPADPAWTEYLAGLQHANDPGDWTYRVGVSANWLNDPTLGDVYVLSGPAAVRSG